MSGSASKKMVAKSLSEGSGTIPEMFLHTTVRPLPSRIISVAHDRRYITLGSSLGCLITADIFALLRVRQTVARRVIREAIVGVLLSSKFLHARSAIHDGSARCESRILCAGRCKIDNTSAGS